MKKLLLKILLGLAFGLLLSVNDLSAASFPLITKEFKHITSQEPAFSEIANNALSNERLTLNDIDKWKKKAKKAAWLPKVSVGYDHYLKQTDALSISDNISVTSDTITIGPQESDLDSTANTAQVIRVRAAWALDEIVMPSANYKISNEVREISSARLKLSDYLFKIYSERRELIAKYLILKKASDPKAVIILAKIEALTDQLDFFTNNQFHQQWWRSP